MKITSDVDERRLRGVGSLSQQVSQRGMFLPVTSVLGGHVIIMLNDSGEDREIDACISSQIQFYLEVERNFFLSSSLSFSLYSHFSLVEIRGLLSGVDTSPHMCFLHNDPRSIIDSFRKIVRRVRLKNCLPSFRYFFFVLFNLTK